LDYDLARAAIKRALAARGWNAADLARDTGKDEGTILDFLNGLRTPQLKTRGLIETALGWPAGAIDDIAAGGLIPVVGEAASVLPSLSVVPAIVEPPIDEEGNEVLEAIRRDPYLDDDAKAHYENQYELLREMSARRRSAKESGEQERLPYVAHGRRTTPVDPEEEKRLEDIAREARRRNLDGDGEVPPK